MGFESGRLFGRVSVIGIAVGLSVNCKVLLGTRRLRREFALSILMALTQAKRVQGAGISAETIGISCGLGVRFAVTS